MTSPAEISNRALARAICLGGVIAGAWDLLFAFVYYGARGAKPMRILQSVAAGLLGRASFDGGIATAALGAGLHFLIAFIIAALFVAAAYRWRILVARPFVAGPLYGAAVFLVMNLVVLPLSALPARPWPPRILTPELIAHMIGVGLPIVLAARAALSPAKT